MCVQDVVMEMQHDFVTIEIEYDRHFDIKDYVTRYALRSFAQVSVLTSYCDC